MKVSYKCDGNAIYNPNTTFCQTGIQCYTFNPTTGLCKNNLNKPVAHPLAKQFYVFCGTKLVLFKCKSEPKYPGRYELDNSTTQCEYICTIGGRFKDLYDSTNRKYYECVKNGSSFIKTRKTCPEGTTFDPDKQACGKAPPPPNTNF